MVHGQQSPYRAMYSVWEKHYAPQPSVAGSCTTMYMVKEKHNSSLVPSQESWHGCESHLLTTFNCNLDLEPECGRYRMYKKAGSNTWPLSVSLTLSWLTLFVHIVLFNELNIWAKFHEKLSKIVQHMERALLSFMLCFIVGDKCIIYIHS